MSFATRCWLAAQVELQGQYSVHQLRDFDHYHSSTPWWRVIITLVATPLPCVLCVVLVDLLKLEPPTSSSLESPRFWTRTFLFTIAMTLSTLEHFRQHILGLNFSLTLIATLSLIVSVATTSVGIMLSLVIGYPMPFTIVIATFPWFFILTTGIALAKWRELTRNKRLVSSALRYLIVCMCQIVITVFYPLYNHVFKRIPSRYQSLFVLVLPLFKIVAKNWIARALDASDVGKPEAVVFNVELFHALYVVFCMQNATSMGTIVAIMGVDFIQAWLSFTDVHTIEKELRLVISKLGETTPYLFGTRGRRQPHSLFKLAGRLVASEMEVAKTQTHLLSETGEKHSNAPLQVLPRVSYGHNTPPLMPTPLSQPVTPQPSLGPKLASIVPLLSSDRGLNHHFPTVSLTPKSAECTALMSHMQHLLFVTEFVVLVEYTEVIMPIIYNILTVALYQLPNRTYYPFLKGLDAESLFHTLRNVLLCASLELLSLILFTAIIWRKLRFSLLHQLAFVLEKRQRSVQSKLIVWVAYVMQCSITHFGADYSFRFEWLRRDSNV